MSKYRHIQIKSGNGTSAKKRNQKTDEPKLNTLATSRLVDKLGIKSTKNQNDSSRLNKSSLMNQKRGKRISNDSNEDDSKEIRYNSQAKRKITRDKEDIDAPRKNVSFEKRNVDKKPKKKILKNKENKKNLNNKKNKIDDSDLEDDNETSDNKQLKKLKTDASKGTLKSKKKSTKNGDDKFNSTFSRAKTKAIEEKNKDDTINKEKNDKYVKKKTAIIDKKDRKKMVGKSADRAANRKGNNKKTKKAVNKKSEQKKEESRSSSSSSSGSRSNSKSSKSSQSSNTSSLDYTSSSYSSDEQLQRQQKQIIFNKSKTNIDKPKTKIDDLNKQEQKPENKDIQNPSNEVNESAKTGDQQIINNIPNLAPIKPAPPEGRKGSIVLGTKYLRRRSMDNPYTRERLELLVNQMTLKQNGGNTLFLKNYETGQTYVKEITHITKDQQTLKKHIKISSCTKAGCKGPGIVKTNQDAFFIKENFLKNNEYFFIGVCDGHGEYGHIVSNFVINKLPTYVKDLSNESITSAFKKANNDIYSNSKLDSSMSGTTVVSIILTPNNILCINLGDSRAALFKYDNGIYYCKNLSRDHKPSEHDEARRIDLMGGRIKKCYDQDLKRFVGPDRVWVKNKEEPGLAMTRSLGDKIAHNIGVTDEPEFKSFTYDGTEKFIILASDGLWEYVSGDQCISIVKPFYEEGLDAQEAALSLTKEAFRRWKRKEVAIDDITVVVIFFYQ